MAGEKILIVDDSAGIQEVAISLLRDSGYRVVTASNGLAALTYPDLQGVDLLLIDCEMQPLSGLDTSRFLKSDKETFKTPILLLVPEEISEERASQSLGGANAFLLKPFTPQALLSKVRTLLDEKEILEKAEKFLQEEADKYVQQLAESQIQAAVERKTQILVERTIQNVVSLVDQKTRREVDQKVTSLTAEKEQELVKMTVHEVARSMVEKLAERKVTEAMEAILAKETEKQVKRATDSLLPTMVRDRIKESIEHILPREVQTRVQRAAEEQVPDISNKIIQVIDGIAQKVVPKIIREKLPEMADRQMEVTSHALIPRLVRDQVASELKGQLEERIQPLIDNTTREINRKVLIINGVVGFVVLALAAYVIFSQFAAK
ncbi:MAG: response regulator [bacterium]